MKRSILMRALVTSVLLLVTGVANAQGTQQKGATDFDVQHYKLDVELIPSQQLLRAKAEVKLIPASETRSLIFEMNGSLAIKRIVRLDAHPTASSAQPVQASALSASTLPKDSRPKLSKDVKAAQPVAKDGAAPAQPQSGDLQFIQDNRENMNVRIDLGSVTAAGHQVILQFEYEGALESPQGGPISNARLAYVGEQGSYLFYASRWFPFHEYAADRAAYDVNIKVPRSVLVAGYSEQPVTITPSTDPKTKEEFSTFSFKCSKPVLPGNFAAAKYIIRSTNYSGLAVDFYVKAGDEKWADHAAEIIGRHLEYFSSKFARYSFGNKLVVAETDEETLETYSGPGIMFISPKALTSGIDEKQAPSQLDDQTPAYRSVIYNKGALVLNMLRQLMGEKPFDKMLTDLYEAYDGKNINLDEFEAFASKSAGRNLRFFFGQWVDSTGVPEFRSEYRVLRTRDGFRVPGTVKQDLDTFEMPVEITLRTEAGNEKQTLMMKGTSADFDITTNSKPIEVLVDPDSRILRSSEELRQGVIVRRGIEHFREQEYVEAEQQFQAAIKLNRGNSWAWYNLGLLYMTQRNWNKALDAYDQALGGALRPDWIEVWSYVYRGNCWDMIGQRERAVSEYNKAISNGSNYDNAQTSAQNYLAEPYGKKKTTQQPSDNQNDR
ncbi:MAG: tetratricopeptide repeat protein [Acidobacteria bacterium]|nr:tetratricopeptide repeat protein [Acidobacteriota bacterium]